MNRPGLLLTAIVIAAAVTNVSAGEPRQLSIVSRQTILAKDDVQLHFPFLHEAQDGIWYMTYREGRHGSKQETVYCIMSSDGGKSWKPWPGLQPEPKLRLFRRRLCDGTWISHRYLFRVNEERTGEGVVLRSSDDGATWNKRETLLAGLPFAAEESAGMWGRIVEMPDGRLLCGVYGRKKQRGRYINGIVESNDGGKSWRYLSHLCDDSSLGDEGPDEMGLVRVVVSTEK